MRIVACTRQTRRTESAILVGDEPRAAVATLLGLDREDVPDLTLNGLKNWARGQGWVLHSLPETTVLPVYYVGVATTGELCLCFKDEIIYYYGDPNRKGTKSLEIDHILVPIPVLAARVPSPMRGAKTQEVETPEDRAGLMRYLGFGGSRDD